MWLTFPPYFWRGIHDCLQSIIPCADNDGSFWPFNKLPTPDQCLHAVHQSADKPSCVHERLRSICKIAFSMRLSSAYGVVALVHLNAFLGLQVVITRRSGASASPSGLTQQIPYAMAVLLRLNCVH